MAADGTFRAGIAGAGPALDEPDIIALARAAADIAVKAGRVLRLGFVKVGRDHVATVRERVERMAAQILRDYLHGTPRGVRRAARQRRAGAEPASVLDPRCLAAVVANAMRDARRKKRPPRSKAAPRRRRGRGAKTWRDVPSMPVGDRGDPGLVDSRRRDAAAEIEEIEIVGVGAEPVLWLMALEARAEAEAERRCPVALPAPRPRARRPKPILHLKRRAGGAP